MKGNKYEYDRIYIYRYRTIVYTISRPRKPYLLVPAPGINIICTGHNVLIVPLEALKKKDPGSLQRQKKSSKIL